MKYEVIALSGVYKDGRVMSPSLSLAVVAVCKTLDQALDFVRRKTEEAVDDCVPHVERLWYAVRRSEVALLGYE